MRRPAILGGRVLAVAALPAALLVTTAVVSASSYSVFNATTTSPNNTWNAGSVVMKNDSNGSSQAVVGGPLYTVTGLTPTSSAVQKCVTVQSTGTLASAVKLYVQNASTVNSLATWLNVTVEIGTATSTTGGACTGFSATSTLSPSGALSSFETSYPNYGSGLATGWSPTGSGTETRVFRFTVAPNSGMSNTQQNGSATVDFVWEADNT